MADEKLVEKVGALLKKGASQDEVKEELVALGWGKEDINGALAVHALSQKPVGSNIMDRWEYDKQERKKESSKNLYRILLYVVLLVVVLFGADYYGLGISFGHTLHLRDLLDGYASAVVAAYS